MRIHYTFFYKHILLAVIQVQKNPKPATTTLCASMFNRNRYVTLPESDGFSSKWLGKDSPSRPTLHIQIAETHDSR